MTLIEISKYVYETDELAFKARVKELKAEKIMETDDRRRGELEQRIRKLKEILDETRRLKRLTANYYACRRRST